MVYGPIFNAKINAAHPIPSEIKFVVLQILENEERRCKHERYQPYQP